MSTQSSSDPEKIEPFDETNGLAGDQLGESDGTADGETTNAAERGDQDDQPAILGRLLDDD